MLKDKKILISFIIAVSLGVFLGFFICSSSKEEIKMKQKIQASTYHPPSTVAGFSVQTSRILSSCLATIEKRENITVAMAPNLETTQIKREEKREECKWISLGTFCLTAYEASEESCGEFANGFTATGTEATSGRTIAVDPKIIPYGTEVKINDKIYIAEDCGGAIKGQKIDIFFNTIEECHNFGVKKAEVYIQKTVEITTVFEDTYKGDKLISSEIISETEKIL